MRQFLTEVTTEDTTNVDESSEDDAVQDLEEFCAMLTIPEPSGSDVDEEDVHVLLSHTTADENEQCFAAHLRESSSTHALTTRVYDSSRYMSSEFYGILIDTGCSKASTGGSAKYRAYCCLVGTPPDIDLSNRIVCHFGVGNAKSLGVATISFPLKDQKLSVSIHILDEDLPLLLSLADMDRLQLYYNNVEDKLIHTVTGNSMDISCCFGHPFLK